MSWLKLILPADRDSASLLADALAASGAISVTIEAAEETPVLQAALEEVPLWSRNRVIGLFPEHVDVAGVMREIRASTALPVAEPEIDLLPDANWAFAWMAHYKPFEVVPGLWVCPTWMSPPRPEAVTILLDPGLAFGTGEHPTTALCLEWLLQQDLAGRTVLDYGCGSGILAIAALKRGAAAAIGVDIDPQALVVARENAVRNKVDDRFRALLPDELPEDFRADAVVANILANALVALAPRLATATKPEGRLALSGILKEQAEDVRAAYAGEFELERRDRSSWVLLAGRRRLRS
ncbi:50S ribosomal protein L11 methyltransferase [Sulfurifustis variabilis]|uniref:Ribosomal protein L11 methyltransferase n=1 Tax=Sulfurifustis variabilis TaxID=1675686 RepID=A0A1C7AFZ6_9GAMM|nr:50S ribosomal protein L11 methyltransferase [Sulfurifustis variabilis]BAU50362.1 50S ribosomal protein L11 methyltransferase [Sulfurifustis variabilis]